MHRSIVSWRLAAVVVAALFSACTSSPQTAARTSPSPRPASPVASAVPSPPPVTSPAPDARIDALQKGLNGTATAADLITLSSPAATMRVVPFWAVQTDDDWVGSIVAANNFGPQPSSLADRLLLHDSAGRTFKNLGPSDFPQYDSLLNTEQSEHATTFGDHPLVAYTLPIPPGQDAFVLLIFHIAPDSDDVTMVAAS